MEPTTSTVTQILCDSCDNLCPEQLATHLVDETGNFWLCVDCA